MAEFERIKIGMNDYGFNLEMREQNDRKQRFQTIINKVIALNLDITFDNDDLTPLFENPKSFFCQKLVSEPMIISGVELDKEKVFDLMKTPPQLTEIINEILHIKQNGLQTAQDNFFFRHSHNFEIKNNVVYLLEDVQEDITDNYSLFLNSEKQKQIKESFDEIVTHLNTLKGLNFGFRLENLFDRYIKESDNVCRLDLKVISDIK